MGAAGPRGGGGGGEGACGAAGLSGVTGAFVLVVAWFFFFDLRFRFLAIYLSSSRAWTNSARPLSWEKPVFENFTVPWASMRKSVGIDSTL